MATKRSVKPLLDVDASMETDDVAAAIRAELRSLAASQDNKAAPGYTMSVMANVFYDIEDALAARPGAPSATPRGSSRTGAMPSPRAPVDGWGRLSG